MLKQSNTTTKHTEVKMSKQTAVEWLENKLDIILPLDFEWDKLEKILKQAKQMHKEEIEDAHIEGQRVFDKHPHTQWTNDQAEQYYNETYGK